ncbi:MAG TPA: ABC transporter permease [Gemmatimonadaceae bacterium]|nr:ABC transporter permease [Gemmatimonadaceae bacterium]
MEHLLQDVRYAARVLRKRPTFTMLAVLCLTLGIGATAAIFSVVDAALLRPLPFPESARLMSVSAMVDADRFGPVSAPDFVDWRAQSKTMELAAWRARSLSLGLETGAERVPLALVSANLFHVLQASPVLGRGFTLDEEQPGHTNVAVLSWALWQRQFGGARSAVGKTIRIDAREYTIVGVMPASFDFPLGTSERSQLWIPLTLGGDSTFQQSRGAHSLEVGGRLRPGATREQAAAEMVAITKRLSELYPRTNARFSAGVVPLRERLVGGTRPTLLMLAGAVAFVLLIACANVGNLMLARATGRFREIAVRSALGAGRGRIVRQLLVESVLLAMAGGVLGLLLASWGTALLKSLLPPSLPHASDIGVDWRVALFALAVSLSTGMLFGLAPALQAARTDLQSTLKDSARGSTGAGSGHRLRSAFVVAQVALSVMLVAGAGLLTVSLMRLERVDAGIHPDGVISASIRLPDDRYADNASVLRFYGRVVERMRALPGVTSAGAVLVLPLSGSNAVVGLVLDGHPVEPGHEAGVAFNTAYDGYFDAIGMRLVSGRAFDAHDDTASVPVAIVNEAFAKKYWPGENPLGQRLSVTVNDGAMRQVVGVVADVRRDRLDEAAVPEVFAPERQVPFPGVNVVVRTSGTASSVAGALRREVAALDPDVAVGSVRTMDEVLTQSLAQRRFAALLLGLFAAVALVLAATGIYGVMTSMVTQRTRELAVRVALGAKPADVLGLVLRQGLVLTVMGIVAGVAGALALAKLLTGLLYGVGGGDPVTLAVVSLLLGGVALVASYLPARRATRVDPLLALQAE